MISPGREVAVVIPPHIKAGSANLPKSYEAAKACWWIGKQEAA
mgnify:CR=1 FL=1